MILSQNWKDIETNLARQLLNGTVIKTEKWQGVSTPAPMLEKLFAGFQFVIPETVEALLKNVSPNTPWAEDHFQERVAGDPVNPGKEYKNWPYYKNDPSNDKFREKITCPVCSTVSGLLSNPGVDRMGDEITVESFSQIPVNPPRDCYLCNGSGTISQEPQFTHTYMERFWAPQDISGIRYKYGNLENVVDLLSREPDTRQAFLPVWFPEDTGVIHGGRVPCTIGYHFLLRAGHLHCTYTIRSCDFFRHLRDDVYLAARLVQWLIEKAWPKGSESLYPLGLVKPGFLVMNIASLHCWESEKFMLEKGY